MFNVPLLNVPLEDWYCPSGCYCTERIPVLPPGATRFHNCPKLHNLSAPLERVGTDCVNVAIEREDYLNGETQAMGDDGKAYMAISTRYADGREGRVVNAGLATGEMRV
jgi:hypothetical protein